MHRPVDFVLTVYRRLFARYGPQHWWPGDSPFEVMVGAVLTQSAAWQNVEKAIHNLKAAGALNPRTLRQLPIEELARLVYPSGYYNAKARKLKALVEWLGETCGDDLDRLFARDTAALREQLLGVHGIGPETADSILLYAAQKPVFVIDAYTRRIVTRLGLAPAADSYDAFQRLFMEGLHDAPSDLWQPGLRADVPARRSAFRHTGVRLFNEYHALLVRLGKTVCRTRPLCAKCPLFDLCLQDKARWSEGNSKP